MERGDMGAEREGVKQDGWGWKYEIEGTGAYPVCIILSSKGLVTEWEGRGF